MSDAMAEYLEDHNAGVTADVVDVVRRRLADGRHIGDAAVYAMLDVIDALRAQVKERDHG